LVETDVKIEVINLEASRKIRQRSDYHKDDIFEDNKLQTHIFELKQAPSLQEQNEICNEIITKGKETCGNKTSQNNKALLSKP
jgi:hypothetical protein